MLLFISPEVRGDSAPTIVFFVFLIGILLLVIFGTSLMTVLLGGIVLGLALLVLYYAWVRFDTWARGGGSEGAT